MTGLAFNSNSLTFFWRWGCFGCVVFLLGSLLGCAGGRETGTALPEAAMVNAQADSLGLEAFLALAPEVQAWRRAEAGTWRNRSEAEEDPAARIRSLTRAAGLAPDDPETWLLLANIWRWLGDYLRASASLDNAATAVRGLNASGGAGGLHPPSYRKEAQRGTALTRAWLHWDRGEWQEGLEWAEAGLKVDPGSRDMTRICGLLAGSQDYYTQATEYADILYRNAREDMSFIHWIRAAVERRRGNYRGALSLVSELTPKHDRASEFFRDRGELAELLEEWTLAKRWYQESARALPFRSLSALSQTSHLRLEPGSGDGRMPVWLAFDRYYITGSLSAYTALAKERYQTEKDPEAREFWAGQVVNAAGILLRRGIHPAWSLRARGLVFADRDRPARAVDDLRRASRLLGEAGYRDLRVEAGLGHLYLEQENYRLARPRLRAALDLDPDNGQVWGDLGLCLVKLGDRVGAEEALTNAIRLTPDSATVWYNRGLMHLQAGNYDQAEADLAEAARLAPGHPEVGRLLQRVQLLKRK